MINNDRVNERARRAIVSTVIQLRVNQEIKDLFDKACKKNGVTISDTLRSLMLEYIEMNKD